MQPAEGQYIVHDVDNLVLPYLPDPFADGVALVFYEAGADHRLANPRVLQSVVVKFAGQWPETAAAPAGGPPCADGWTPARWATSSTSVCRPASRSRWRSPPRWTPNTWRRWALWRFHPVHDPNVPEADRRILARAARDGWLWWLTPDEDLRLVHATARPGDSAGDLAVARRAAQPERGHRQPRRCHRRARRQHRQGRATGALGRHRRRPRHRWPGRPRHHGDRDGPPDRGSTSGIRC